MKKKITRIKLDFNLGIFLNFFLKYLILNNVLKIELSI